MTTTPSGRLREAQALSTDRDLLYYYPVDAEQSARIDRDLAKWMQERYASNMDYTATHVPGFTKAGPREELAFLRSKDIAWWQMQFELSPTLAAGLMRRWYAIGTYLQRRGEVV